MNSSTSENILDEFISKYKPDGEVSFEDDDSNALFEAVARYANNSKPLPSTAQEIDDFLESIPLFATRMPEPGQESEAFKAVQSLMGSKEAEPDGQTVGQFKDRGNNAYKLAIRLGDAKEGEKEADKKLRLETRKKKIYEALNAYYSAIQNKDSLVIDETQTREDADRLLSQIYGNIAASHMLLENHGHCVNECKLAIKLWKKNIKAYYRMGLSLFKLHKYQASFITIQQGLQLSVQEKSAAEFKQFIALAQKVVLAWKRADEYERKLVETKRQQYETKIKEDEEVKTILAARKIVLGPAQFRQDVTTQYEGAKYYVGEKKELHMPLILLYPEVGQSDFLRDVDEYATMNDVLNILFPVGQPPLPWDEHNQYRNGNLEVFCYIPQSDKPLDKLNGIDDANGVKLPVPLKMGLGHALAQLCKKGHLVPKFPTFCIAPKQPAVKK